MNQLFLYLWIWHMFCPLRPRLFLFSNRQFHWQDWSCRKHKPICCQSRRRQYRNLRQKTSTNWYQLVIAVRRDDHQVRNKSKNKSCTDEITINLLTQFTLHSSNSSTPVKWTYSLTIRVRCPCRDPADILIDIHCDTRLGALINVSALAILEFITVGTAIAPETSFSIDTEFIAFWGLTDSTSTCKQLSNAGWVVSYPKPWQSWPPTRTLPPETEPQSMPTSQMMPLSLSQSYRSHSPLWVSSPYMTSNRSKWPQSFPSL